MFLHDQKTGYVPGIHFESKDEAMNEHLTHERPGSHPVSSDHPAQVRLSLGRALGRKRERDLFRLLPKPRGVQIRVCGDVEHRAFSALLA